MSKKYTNEKNIQMLIYLLKVNDIKKIIVNPGTMNMSFVASVQNDDFFEMYSCVDERSACYMACGLAAESGDPVVLTCTGATASRNYMPGLTEAFYFPGNPSSMGLPETSVNSVLEITNYITPVGAPQKGEKTTEMKAE